MTNRSRYKQGLCYIRADLLLLVINTAVYLGRLLFCTETRWVGTGFTLSYRKVLLCSDLKSREPQYHHKYMRLKIESVKDNNVLATSMVLPISMDDDNHFPSVARLLFCVLHYKKLISLGLTLNRS